jgi:ABC-type nitrate/sulfonate/bicarbonate transport system substrate-binding protein
MVQQHPDELRRFVRGWFETVAWMRTHKPETIAIASRLSGLPEAVQAREYDEVMPTLSADGRFQPKALAALARSFVDVGTLDEMPDMTKLTTEAFLPNPAR